MPGKKKLEEEFTEIKKEEVEKEIVKAKDENKRLKHLFLKQKLKRIRLDVYYTLIISLLCGFMLWAWQPELFSIYRALALGIGWMLLFNELQLHKMFKKE